MSKKKKFYVVWRGVKPGIYESWDDCKAQVYGFDNALYKSFGTLELAEKAFDAIPQEHFEFDKTIRTKDIIAAAYAEEIISDSLAVDAACSGNPGLMEYRGVYIADNVEIFHAGPWENGTNNIGEFLAIVHALAHLKKTDRDIPIYSDSISAIKWVADKKCNTKLKLTENNRIIFELIVRAERWLKSHSYSNPILKWDSEQWGEIPADFGRK